MRRSRCWRPPEDSDPKPVALSSVGSSRGRPVRGIPADEVGLPPLSEAEQEAVAREADRLADDPDARRNL
ncbi:hypothetical protein GCM10009776_27740 [Microbacterium deminutum]|uniref:Uncharacterized protein n=1 Tax=Microbacterium deminutum TaxID=344164 RepID=A0ABN2R4G8_9MICO